ncbi:3D domain-containing protein [Thalassorhabdus alkalitolerans]|uniref:3D domain-containing protein n=2 Tax=Thalassorhabdus alkalitolerans TaxID=2282697 RepID=A0ABW0YNK8_9BACI
MEPMKTVGRRVTMSVLVLAAFMFTVDQISGVQPADISNWLEEQPLPWKAPQVDHIKEAGYKSSRLNYKGSFQDQTGLSSEKETMTLSQQPLKNYPAKHVVATGYTAGPESTGKSPGHPAYGITYSGVEARRDVVSTIAADPEHFPIGTVLYIPEYGYGVVADTGSAIKGMKIDLFYETTDEVFEEWGKRELEVYVIREGKGRLDEQDYIQINSQIKASL